MAQIKFAPPQSAVGPAGDLWGSASGSDHLTAPPTTAIKKEMPPLRWRRYGAAVSHVQALKGPGGPRPYWLLPG